MRVLFIGGTGIISSACARLAVERGHRAYLLNRGRATAAVPDGVDVLAATSATPGRSARRWRPRVRRRGRLGRLHPGARRTRDLELFRGRTGQYVFISSASAYQTPPARLPITESTPLRNPFWRYSRDKIACEERC